MGRRAKAPTLDINTMSVEVDQYKQAINDVVDILSSIADRYETEALAWDDSDAMPRRLREDRAFNIRNAITEILEKTNT